MVPGLPTLGEAEIGGGSLAGVKFRRGPTLLGFLLLKVREGKERRRQPTTERREKVPGIVGGSP